MKKAHFYIERGPTKVEGSGILKICARLIWVCIYDVFKDEYFLHHPSLPYLKPKLIATRNPIFFQSKDFSTQHHSLNMPPLTVGC